MIGWPQNAYVGQKVVCIVGDGWVAAEDAAPPCPLVQGQVYTIAGIWPVKIAPFKDRLFFALADFDPRDVFAAVGFKPAKDTSAAVEKLKRDVLRPKVGEPVA